MISNVKKFIQKTFSSLKIRNYRLYFTGQIISTSGTFMQGVAQAWLVLKLTNSGTALGIVTALQFLPLLLLGPSGGILADRFSKRKLLFATQSASGMLAIVLGSLVLSGDVRLWIVYVIALLLGLINTVDNPTRQTFISEMVGEGELKNAIALNSTLMNLARVIGPTIAGILIVTVGLAPCFFFNGISFFAVVAVLAAMRSHELHRARRSHTHGKFLDGFRYIVSKPVLRMTLIMMAIIGTLTYEFQVSLPLLAQMTFHGDARSYAALTTAMGFGSVIGGVIAAGSKKIGPRIVVVSAFFFGLTIVLTAIMPTLHLSVMAMIVVGFFSIYFTSLGNATMQLGSAPEMRGRVMAFWSMAFLGSTAIGGPIIGWIGEHIGPRWGLGVGGFAAIIAAALGAFTLKKERFGVHLSGDGVTTAHSLSEGDTSAL
jgi:MFS family permease